MKRDVIQCSCLGRMGRFGNQLFQYAFARSYAESHGCELQTHPWIGQVLFQGINDPLIASPLPKTHCDNIPFGEVNIDLNGFFQGPTFLDIYSRGWVRDIFVIKPDWRVPSFEVAYAVHQRHGDYSHGNPFRVLELQPYLDLLTSKGWLRDADWFSEEKPRLFKSLPNELGFIADFQLMMSADVLIRANSTFSWWAAVLGYQKEIYSPLLPLDEKAPYTFVAGNDSPIMAHAPALVLKP